VGVTDEELHQNALEVCRILAEDLDWCIGYELYEKNQEPLDKACQLAAAVIDEAKKRTE